MEDNQEMIVQRFFFPLPDNTIFLKPVQVIRITWHDSKKNDNKLCGITERYDISEWSYMRAAAGSERRVNCWHMTLYWMTEMP
jgi:hypothetical protein